MTTEGTQPSREQLEAAIAAQERLRSTLGDVIVDATIAALRTQLAQLTEVAQQRKLATVLFMDVVGSTKLIQGRDPEEAWRSWTRPSPGWVRPFVITRVAF